MKDDKLIETFDRIDNATHKFMNNLVHKAQSMGLDDNDSGYFYMYVAAQCKAASMFLVGKEHVEKNQEAFDKISDARYQHIKEVLSMLN